MVTQRILHLKNQQKNIAWSRIRTWDFFRRSVEVEIFSQGVKIHPDVFAVYFFFVQPQGASNPKSSVVLLMCYHYTNLALIVGRVVSYYDLYD